MGTLSSKYDNGGKVLYVRCAIGVIGLLTSISLIVFFRLSA